MIFLLLFLRRDVQAIDRSMDIRRPMGIATPVITNETDVVVLNFASSCNDNLFVCSFEGPINNQYTSWKNSCVYHGAAAHPDKEGSRKVSDQMLIQIQAASDIIICQAWKSGFNGCPLKRPADFCALIGRVYFHV